MSSMVTTGYYINVFKPNGVDLFGNEHYLYDLYVVLNEPNDPPTPEEVTKIEEAISKINPLAMSADGNKAIEDLNLNCTRFGFKIAKLIEYD